MIIFFAIFFQITWITPYKVSTSNENLTQILLHDNYFEDIFENPFEMKMQTMWSLLIKHVSEECVKAMTHPKITELLQESFDAVLLPIFFTDCFLSYTYEKKVWFNFTPNEMVHFNYLIDNNKRGS